MEERALRSTEVKSPRERRRRFRYLAKDHFAWSQKIPLRRPGRIRAREEIVLWVFLSVVAAGTITALLSADDAPRSTTTSQK
jgi:hypothetical protein